MVNIMMTHSLYIIYETSINKKYSWFFYKTCYLTQKKARV